MHILQRDFIDYWAVYLVGSVEIMASWGNFYAQIFFDWITSFHKIYSQENFLKLANPSRIRSYVADSDEADKYFQPQSNFFGLNGGIFPLSN